MGGRTETYKECVVRSALFNPVLHGMAATIAAVVAGIPLFTGMNNAQRTTHAFGRFAA